MPTRPKKTVRLGRGGVCRALAEAGRAAEAARILQAATQKGIRLEGFNVPPPAG